ncbi:MAG: acetate kinase [Trueperaceae bacterium]
MSTQRTGGAHAAQVLVVNAGSSSLKMKLLPSGESVLIERLGGPTSVSASFTVVESPRLERHDHAFDFGLRLLEAHLGALTLAAVGHRVVHGGTRFVEPTLITSEVEAAIEELCPLAPLHNPGNLAAVRAARSALPGVAHVAVFDTAFHATLPPHAYHYGLPLEYAQQGMRRYGFHGSSHQYVAQRAAELLERPQAELRMITLHLGNGASATAVAGGRSVDTSMGFTPLEGLLMGTRTGDIDPGLLIHLLRGGMPLDQLDQLLNRGAGLRGMSGISNDMRDVRQAARNGEAGASAALALFAYRVRKTIGAYAAAMGGLDAIVFTGGIGENDAASRADCLAGLEFLGVELDASRNAAGEETISAEHGAVKVLVVKTDEEGLIAEQAREVAARLGRKDA